MKTKTHHPSLVPNTDFQCLSNSLHSTGFTGVAYKTNKNDLFCKYLCDSALLYVLCVLHYNQFSPFWLLKISLYNCYIYCSFCFPLDLINLEKVKCVFLIIVLSVICQHGDINL